MAGEVIAMPDASRMQAVRTASENQMKWLIELSRAVKRTSPMVSPLWRIGWTMGQGRASGLWNYWKYRLDPYGCNARMPEYFAAYHALLQLKIALAAPAPPVFQLLQGHRQNDRCFQTVSHCCCCQCQVFCAYCFRVSTEVTESSNQISIIVINMLVILMLRNAL